MAEALIFGAGKIARGFLGQILFNAGVKTAFVDASEALVKLLNERKQYTVNVLGAPEKNSQMNSGTISRRMKERILGRFLLGARMTGCLSTAGMCPPFFDYDMPYLLYTKKVIMSRTTY